MIPTDVIHVVSAGMMTAVGHSWLAACAAIRCGITGFEETHFVFDGDRVQGAEVEMNPPYRGVPKLIEMAVVAIEDCLKNYEQETLDNVPVILCVSDREGYVDDLPNEVLTGIKERLKGVLHPSSMVIRGGRTIGCKAIEHAKDILKNHHSYCLIVGTDSLLNTKDLSRIHGQRRLLTEKNSDGFIPGEAASAVLLTVKQPESAALHLKGLGMAKEDVTVLTEKPFKALGLAQAIKNAITDCGVGYEHIDYRITDANGEQYFFKEHALANSRTMHVIKQEFDLWHPCDCIGEVGAAAVPSVLAVALMAIKKNYSVGKGILCHFSNDDEERAAIIVRGGKAA